MVNHKRQTDKFHYFYVSLLLRTLSLRNKKYVEDMHANGSVAFHLMTYRKSCPMTGSGTFIVTSLIVAKAQR
jgi:hypothetical protein